MALVNDGEEVIIPAPYWVSYPQMVKLAGGEPVIVNAGFEQDFKMTPEQLEAAITPKTRMLILCSPSNPTGSVYSKEELAALAEVIKRHEDLFVLADEIYEHINYIGHHESIAQFPGMKERAIIVNGVSKAYAMTGWRIGRTSREHSTVPRYEGKSHHCQRCVEGIRHDRMAHRIHCCSRMDSQRLQQATRTIYQRSLLRESEGS